VLSEVAFLAMARAAPLNRRVRDESYDAVIIGGGPGGSAAATYLRQAGKSVLLLEKEIFPRFHVGESLLPYNFELFREMGVLPALAAAGFPRKFGAQFHIGNGSKCTQFVFREGRFNREPEAIQVERAKFDHILLQHARASGAEAREGWTVTGFQSQAEEVTVDAKGPEGEARRFRAPFLIDASGRGNLTGNQEGLREIHPNLRKLAIFGHFIGVRLDPEPRRTDTHIVRLVDKWFWIIPISEERTSVGCVLDADEFARGKKTPEEVFTHWVQSSAVMRERMKDAVRVHNFHTTSDFSYYNRRLVGDRLLRVGDAAGFMDPIFSAGVYLAMRSGKLAAEAVVRAGAPGARRSAVLAEYEKQVWAAMKFYWKMAEEYYTTPFMELFLEPRHRLQLPAAVNAVLAGEVKGGWKMRWRLALFFLLVKVQSRWAVVPRITFD
jgi:FADH2-dependent halogenase